MTSDVAVCTAEVVREVSDKSGTLEVLVGGIVELNVSVNVEVSLRRDVVEGAIADVSTDPSVREEDVLELCAVSLGGEVEEDAEENDGAVFFAIDEAGGSAILVLELRQWWRVRVQVVEYQRGPKVSVVLVKVTCSV